MGWLLGLRMQDGICIDLHALFVFGKLFSTTAEELHSLL
jgi:hypothetical protein